MAKGIEAKKSWGRNANK